MSLIILHNPLNPAEATELINRFMGEIDLFNLFF